jgi:hypothetical protein
MSSFQTNTKEDKNLILIHSLTISYFSKINTVLCPQMIYLPLKKRRDMFSEGNVAHPVGCYSQLQIVMAGWRTFFEFKLAGSGVTACCR